MVKIELTEDQKGSRQFWCNRSKLKPNPDPWHDVVIPGFDGRDAVPEVPPDDESLYPDDKEEPIPQYQQIHPALDLDTDDEFSVPGGMQHEEIDYTPTDAEDEAGATFWLASSYANPGMLQYGHTNDKLSSTFARNLHSEVAEPYIMAKYDSWENTQAAFEHLRSTKPTFVWMANSIESDPFMNSWLLCSVANYQRCEDKYFVLAIPC